MDRVERSEHLRVERRVVVTGGVQGVGFRAFVRDAARSLGVIGWTRNLPDGSVEVEAAGDEGAMAAFVGRLRSGPVWIHVTEVRDEPRSAADALPDPFTILR